jgi:hypothetical protein
MLHQVERFAHHGVHHAVGKKPADVFVEDRRLLPAGFPEFLCQAHYSRRRLFAGDDL